MNEQIEKDRQNVRNGLIINNNKQFSYLKYLKSREKESLNLNKTLKMYNTLEILYFLEDGFIMGNKKILKNIGEFRIEISKRADLFESILQFLDDKKIGSKLHFWLPGHDINNIFMFLVEIMPDFVERYKNYIIKPVIIGQKYKNCFEFIKKIFNKDYSTIKIMKDDLDIFDKCLSLNYWPHANIKYTKGFLKIEEEINVSKDVKGRIIPDLSYVDFNIGNRNFIVTLHEFEGLMGKKDETKEFWKKLGVIDSNWFFL